MILVDDWSLPVRPDMSKVLVERERRGHRDGKPTSRRTRRKVRQRLRTGDEDFEGRSSIKGHLVWGNLKGYSLYRKELNENLSPLYRYVRSQVGRPWRKVHSEICEHIRLDSAVQRHILEHLGDVVELNVRIIGGVPCKLRRYGTSGWIPLTSWGRVAQFFVHPKTGLLRQAPHEQRTAKPNDRRTKAADLPDRIKHPTNRLIQYFRTKGIWYEVTLRRPTTDERERQQWGHWETERSGDESARSKRVWRAIGIGKEEWARSVAQFGAPLLATRRRQLNSREIARLPAMVKSAERRAR